VDKRSVDRTPEIDLDSNGGTREMDEKTQMASTGSTTTKPTKRTNSKSGIQRAMDKVTPAKVATAAGVAAAAAVAGVVAKKLVNRAGTTIAVEPSGDRWQVRVAGNQRPTKTYDLKSEAIEAGRELARKRVPSELVIHKSDGSEQTRHAYPA
jgi:hypothetical protein